ncbi:MAG: Sensor histidine kinase RcsC [Chroococcopsis gigantea SAG 12.99]|jgi:two-component system sensor histidine kinase BarA|nr:sensor histidine kinase [Chlorogloea purpurea SAG 13.99]MDV3001800.1 Sensor histidine kinase RcsC [Chroococcopsis gigantea SAG 12.99]
MPFFQSSFRRILLSRLLLVSVPVLLIGMYVTYRKARSAFLETARQNLTESAVRKGDTIDQNIKALKTSLITATDSIVFKEGTLENKKTFLRQLTEELPGKVSCIQLLDLQTYQLVVSTCDERDITSNNSNPWPKKQNTILTGKLDVYVDNLPTISPKKINTNQLPLNLSAPVYDTNKNLKYRLTIQTLVLCNETLLPGSLSGYTVIIDEKGTILAHPFPQRIGININQEADSERLKSIVNNAIKGRQDFLHLFSFEKNGVELVAGYSSIPSPITRNIHQKWIILAVSPLYTALAPLREIREVLLQMLIALLIASGIATSLIARELARPLEKLRDYALNKDNLNSLDTIPQDFYIREINQLSIALKQMIEHIKAWSEEVLNAWKESENANRLKNEFLATTSHELRTPLNGIIGSIRIIKDGYCDSEEEEKEFLQQADNAAVYLLGIINDILDLSRIESGKLSVNLGPVDLRKIIIEVTNLQLANIQNKELQLNLSHCQDNIIVYADPYKLKQVILNIVGNAIKFTEKGGITIKTKIDDKQAIITIIDTGIGIDPSQQHKLFRPFVMVDGSTTRKFSGTGLGLAISRNLITLMGGNIILFSAGKGQGTTLEITLPLMIEINPEVKKAVSTVSFI